MTTFYDEGHYNGSDKDLGHYPTTPRHEWESHTANLEEKDHEAATRYLVRRKEDVSDLLDILGMV